jgi:glycine/D-amino acid oxidase-like deaminating enzyme
MDYFTEPSRQIPITHTADVLVCGAGPAGVAAALSAARQGAHTLLIEQSGAAGGVATSGLMSHWTGDTAHIGIYGEILQRAQDGPDAQVINPEKLKTVLLEMLVEAGVELQLYTFASDAILQDDVLQGVVAESKSGREAILARITVDATGDGDVAAKAGVPYHKGREGDGKMQPMTLMFKVAGVDAARVVKFVGAFEDSYASPQGDIQALARQHLPFPAGHLLIYPSSLPGIVTCNMTNAVEVDGTQAQDLTRAELVCRSQLEPIQRFLREYVAGFEQCYIINSAASIGVRETRHFAGEYTLTEEDILAARVFEDWAAPQVHFNFDVHNLSGSGLDATGQQRHFPQVRRYTIPYRCFVPLKIDNLYLAGRNISGTHKAHSNYRVMPVCAMMGQAVGTAAALCVQQNTTPRRLKPQDVQAVLTAQGVKP